MYRGLRVVRGIRVWFLINRVIFFVGFVFFYSVVIIFIFLGRGIFRIFFFLVSFYLRKGSGVFKEVGYVKFGVYREGGDGREEGI